jgi:hypothetical protein
MSRAGPLVAGVVAVPAAAAEQGQQGQRTDQAELPLAAAGDEMEDAEVDASEDGDAVPEPAVSRPVGKGGRQGSSPQLDRTSASGPGGRNITSFDRKAQSRIGGYLDNEFVQPFGGRSTFKAHRLILQTSSYLHDNLLFSSEIEYEYGAQIQANSGAGELKIEQAWADYRIDDLLTLRGGIVLMPIGIINVLHDSDFRETTTRPLMTEQVIPSTWMDTGAGFHGLAYPSDEVQVTYEAYVTNGLSQRISAADGLKRARPSFKDDNNGNKALTGRVAVSLWLGLELAASGYFGRYDGERALTLLGGDMTWIRGPFELAGEYARIATEGGSWLNGTEVAAVPTDMRVGTWRKVALLPRVASRHLSRAWRRLSPGHDGPLVGRCGGADTDLPTAGRTDRTELLVGLNYRPTQTFVAKRELVRRADPVTGPQDAFWSSIAVGF